MNLGPPFTEPPEVKKFPSIPSGNTAHMFPSSAISRCNHVRFTYQGKTRVKRERIVELFQFSICFLLSLLNVAIFYGDKLPFFTLTHLYEQWSQLELSITKANYYYYYYYY